MTLAFSVKPGDTFALPSTDGWSQAAHVFDASTLNTINTAILANRPLLVTGEQGVGKSQIARAIALVMNRPLLWHAAAEELNRTASGPALLWHHSQILSSVSPEQAANPVIMPGLFWWAMNPRSAQQHVNVATSCYWKPKSSIQHRLLAQGAVLLLDNIEQATQHYIQQLSMLLERNAFHVPYAETAEIQHASSIPKPICVITSNDIERVDLGILKRCILLPLTFPNKDQLIRIVKSHFIVHDSVCHAAVDRLMQARRVAGMRKQVGPSIRELLDAIKVVQSLSQEPEKQLALLDVTGLDVIGLLSPFKYQKAKLVAGPASNL